MNSLISEKLTPRDIETVLHRLGIEKKGKGWETIKSPLREERNPSFGINLETGAWKDHATDESGDLVTLAERVLNKDTKQAIRWIKEQTDLAGVLYEPPKNGSTYHNSKSEKETKKFWTDDKINSLSDAQKRLKENPDHPVIQQANQYDCLVLETMQFFGAGIIGKWSKDWLAFPYETGCQLYRREDGKVIRSLKGSSPGQSFFGSRKVTGDKDSLYIAKSPRECMLLHQEYGNRADVIGIATGEQGKLQAKQIDSLRNDISASNYSNIHVFMDCDSEAAKITAQSFTDELANALDRKIHLVNIHQSTGGTFKDITDCISANMDEETFQVIIEDAEEIGLSKTTKQTKHPLDVQPEDLHLDDSLLELLPPVVKNYLNYSAPLSDVPNEFLLTPFLAIAGAAIGKKRFIDLGGIQIYPTIWTVLFAGSSTLRKTTALNLAKKPFKPIEDHYKQEYERDLLRWEQRRDDAERNNESFDEEKPVKKTIYAADGFSDLTFWEGLRDNQSQISNVGEFTALWSELTRPRNSMRDLALSIFDAEDSIRRNTKSAGDIELNNPVWCMAGATTLSNFQRTLTSTERGSGLLQRILPVCMEQRTKEYRALTELQKPNTELYNSITDKTKQLIGLDERAVNLTPDARERFTNWSHDIHRRAENLSERLTDIGGFISRLEAYTMKFSLIFQQLHKPEDPISNDNMKAAIALAEWLLHHILYMLDRNYIFNRHYADRLKIRELIEKQDNQQMSRTDLMNMSHFDKDQLDKALASDIEAGIIEEIKIETGGRPLTEYKLTDRA